MDKFKFICLFIAFLLGFQIIYAQEHKHATLTGKEKNIVVKPTRSNFTYTLNVVVTNCEIDGNLNKILSNNPYPCNISTNNSAN